MFKNKELEEKLTTQASLLELMADSLKWWVTAIPALEAERQEIARKEPAKTAAEVIGRNQVLMPYYIAPRALKAYEEYQKGVEDEQ